MVASERAREGANEDGQRDTRHAHIRTKSDQGTTAGGGTIRAQEGESEGGRVASMRASHAGRPTRQHYVYTAIYLQKQAVTGLNAVYELGIVGPISALSHQTCKIG